MNLMLSTDLECPLVPVPVPPAGISFLAVALQLTSVGGAPPGVVQSQLFAAAPRLVSESARSKQYSHIASDVPLPSAVYGGAVGSVAVSSAAGIWPVMTDIDVCSWPGTTVWMPRNSGRFLYAFRYSMSGYWNSCTDCQRHMFLLGLVPDGSPLGVTPELSQVVFGPLPAMKG